MAAEDDKGSGLILTLLPLNPHFSRFACKFSYSDPSLFCQFAKILATDNSDLKIFVDDGSGPKGISYEKLELDDKFKLGQL